MGLLPDLNLRKYSKFVFRNTGNRWASYRMVTDGPITGPESQKIFEVCVP